MPFPLVPLTPGPLEVFHLLCDVAGEAVDRPTLLRVAQTVCPMEQPLQLHEFQASPSAILSSLPPACPVPAPALLDPFHLSRPGLAFPFSSIGLTISSPHFPRLPLAALPVLPNICPCPLTPSHPRGILPPSRSQPLLRLEVSPLCPLHAVPSHLLLPPPVPSCLGLRGTNGGPQGLEFVLTGLWEMAQGVGSRSYKLG